MRIGRIRPFLLDAPRAPYQSPRMTRTRSASQDDAAVAPLSPSLILSPSFQIQVHELCEMLYAPCSKRRAHFSHFSDEQCAANVRRSRTFSGPTDSNLTDSGSHACANWPSGSRCCDADHKNMALIPSLAPQQGSMLAEGLAKESAECVRQRAKWMARKEQLEAEAAERAAARKRKQAGLLTRLFGRCLRRQD